MKHCFVCLFLILGFVHLCAAETLLIEYFFNPNCNECQKVSRLVFPTLEKQAAGKYFRKDFDLSDEKNFMALISRLDQLGDNSNEKVYVIINRRVILGGFAEIKQKLLKIVLQETSQLVDDTTPPSSNNKLVSFRQKMTISAVIVAGLLDGINPCVFTALIFFMSLLAAGNIRRGRIVIIGIVYVIGSFITYLMLGLGLLRILTKVTSFPLLKPLLNYSIILLLICLAVLAFSDAFNFVNKGASGIRMQLPDRWKNQIHSLMRKSRKKAFLLPGIFLLSVAVTLVESVCTGQVYVPTLLLLSNIDDGFNYWWGYLLLYNVMFTFPLIGIFLLTLTGIRMQQFLTLNRRNTLLAKLLTGLFLLLLAIALSFSVQ